MQILTISFVFLVVFAVTIEAPGFYSRGDVLGLFLGGAVFSRIVEEAVEEDPCPSKLCGTGKCVRIGSTAKCLCREGYCGDHCEPSTQLTGEECINICTLANAVCINGQCVCRCGFDFIPQLNPTAGPACRKGCTNGVSDDFFTIEGSVIFSVQTESINSPTLTLSECQDLCREQTDYVCLSVQYTEGTTTNTCSLNQVRKDDSVFYFEDQNDAQTYSERICFPDDRH